MLSKNAIFVEIPIIPLYDSISRNSIDIILSKKFNVFGFVFLTQEVSSQASGLHLNVILMTP